MSVTLLHNSAHTVNQNDFLIRNGDNGLYIFNEYLDEYSLVFKNENCLQAGIDPVLILLECMF